MRNTIVALLLGLGVVVAPTAHGRAASMPCEEALKQLRDKEATTVVADAQKALYDDLKTKGIERCNADDDKRADDFFAQAMALLGQ